jgi:hypothetical protein
MTNNIAETLRECHALVWEYRARLEPYWPTPTVEDCLLFAFTELGEAVDAHLRSNAQYARNRDKDLSVLDELADCAMMLLTALGNEWVDNDQERDGGWEEWQYTWHFYLSELNRLLDIRAQYGDNDDFLFNWQWYAINVVERIATHPGMDLPARLRSRLDRIAAKRMPADTDNDQYAAALLRQAGQAS